MFRLIDPGSAPLRHLWWLAPIKLFALVIGGTMTVAAFQDDHAFRLYGTPKFIELTHVVLAAGAILVFAIGGRLAWITGRTPEPTPPSANGTVRFWFYLTTGLTLFGYVVWVASAVKNGLRPATILQFLQIDDPLLADALRDDYFGTIPGITTCTQFGMAAVLLGLWLYFHGDKRALWPIGLLTAIAAVRALVLSERLALAELVVPALVVVLRVCVLGKAVAQPFRGLLHAAPVMGALALVVFFGGFEYFRSWRYYQDEFNSYAEFSVWRVAGYYTTAHNNGAMAMTTGQRRPLPYSTIQVFWNFPGVEGSPLDYTKLTRVNPEEAQLQTLALYGTVELNNEGGLFQPALDLGPAGYLLFWFGYGFLAGRLYRSFLVGTLAGLTFYPLIMLSILEVPRFLYLCYARPFPTLVALAAVIWLTRRATYPAMTPIAQPA